MPDAAQQQTSFLGGEWSPYAQGRVDHPKYRTAMNVCFNGMPLEEGAWTRRPGTWHMGHTRNGADGRLINFDFTEPTPYKIELTNARLRLWSATGLVYTGDPQFVVAISTGTPAVIQIPAVDWVSGDQVQFIFNETLPENCALLQNRTFTIQETGANDGTEWALYDDITGDAIDGSALNWSPAPGTIQVCHILEILTTYVSDNWGLDKTRFVQSGVDPDGTINGEGFLLSATTPPQVLECTQALSATPNFAGFELNPADFLDGPYLDAVSGLFGTPSAVATVGPVVLQPWSPAIAYVLGNCVNLVGIDTSALPGGPNVIGLICVVAVSTPGNNPINGDNPEWAYILPPGLGQSGAPAAWNATASYFWGDQVTYSATVGTVTTTTTYTSVAPEVGNIGHNPSTDGGVHWIAYTTASADSAGGGLGPGSIQFDIAYQAWSNSTNYNVNDYVTDDGLLYRSLADGNYNNAPSSGLPWVLTSGVPGVNNGFGFLPTDIGRNIRLFSEPPIWSSVTEYFTGQSVQYPYGQQQYWTAQKTNTNVVPGTDITSWLPGVNVAQWAWGRITAVNSSTEVIIALIGFSPVWTVQGALDTLLYSSTVFTWQLGVYSMTTGYPTVGCYHGGRVYFGGVIPNRFDATAVNSIIGAQVNFAPTAYDGTVGDGNGISETLNSDTLNQINWMKSVSQGCLIGTLAGEWLIEASNLNDPITPTTIQVQPTSRYGTAAIEPLNTPLASLFVQKLKRKVMEYLPDVFTGRYRAPNLSVFAKHLTAAGVEEIRYQEEIAPIVWMRCDDGTWDGCTYRRINATVYGESQEVVEAAIAGWHRHSLGSGRISQSIMVGPNYNGVLDTLTMVTTQTASGAPDQNIRHVEELTPLFEEGTPLLNAWFLDDAIVPSSLNATSTGVTLNGLWDLNGKTVTAWVGGLDCGDYTVANGSIFVPWGAAGPAPARAGLFTLSYLQGLTGNDYGNATASLSSVQLIPAIAALPTKTQWQVDQTPGRAGLDNWACIPLWDKGTCIFLETDGSLVLLNMTTGAVLQYVAGADVAPSGHYIANVGCGWCLASDGFIYGSTAENTILRIDTTSLKAVQESADLGLVIEGMAPVITTTFNTTTTDLEALASLTDNTGSISTTEPYIVLGINNLTEPGEMYVFSPATMALVSGSSFTAPEGSNSYMTVGSGSQSAAYGTAGNNNSSLIIYRVLVGAGGAPTYSTLATILATALGPLYTTITSDGPIVVDQTDGNLLQFVGMNNSDTWLLKLDATDGSIIWQTKCPGGNLATAQNSWNNSRINGGVCVFTNGNNICIVDTVTGALSTYALGSGNGQLGGGQASDSITGVNLCFSSFNAGTNLLSIKGTNGTPSDFSYQWSVTPAAAFKGFQVTETSSTIPAIVGFNMTSQGQILRAGSQQDAGSAIGLPQGKTRRSHMFAALLANTLGVSFGASFTNLFPAKLANPDGSVNPPTVMYNGVWWDTLAADYNFDDMLCWQINRPYPATVASVSTFRHTQDR